MRTFMALVTVVVLAGCSTGPATRHQPHDSDPSMTAAVDFLLTSAAADFHAHRPPYPARFRHVRSGYLVGPEGTRLYRVCGEFLPAPEDGEAEWIPFATIATSGYEQWVGPAAVAYCSDAAMTWDAADLSSALQVRLDALR